MSSCRLVLLTYGMPSIGGVSIKATSFNERTLKGGENVIEYDIAQSKWLYQISNALTLRVWGLTMVEDAISTSLSSSIYTILYNAYKNNTTLTFVCDFSFHNLGSMQCKVYSPPTCQYSINERGSIRVISVELIES